LYCILKKTVHHGVTEVKPFSTFAARLSQQPLDFVLFTSERGAPFTTAGFARMVERAGEAGKLGFKAHPHMPSPACGLRPCQQGARHAIAARPYLGHKNIQHTVRYIELAPDRFKDFWR
jgi:site-specific recombinase XerD